jgi:hypothetical protein
MLSPDDLDALRYAKRLLENPGLAAKITTVLGRPIEKGLDLLPQKWAQVVAVATRTSLETALQVALATMGDTPRAPSWERLHKLAAATTGAAGGAFGLAGLSIELPVSTTLMVRSIADIARSEGERLATPEAKLACLEVFAMGGRNSSDDASESAYFFCPGYACEGSIGGGEVPGRKGRGGEGGAGPPAADHATRGPLRGERVREGGRAGRARHRGRRRGRDKPALHRSFPGHGPRALHHTQA